MNPETTRPSLLSRVRDPSDDLAWTEFDQQYRELVLRYSRARGLQQADAEDVRQIVMINLSKALRNFEYDPQRGHFRGYLGRTVRNAISRHFGRNGRANAALDTAVLATVPRGDSDSGDDLWEQEWISHHYRLAMQSVRQAFDAQSVEVFDRILQGETTECVAASFSMSQQAVHKVKQRIRNRLKDLVAAQIRAEDDPDGLVP